MRLFIAFVMLGVLVNLCHAQTVPSICPIANFSGKTSEFGPRMHPVLKTQRDHNGMDFFVAKGTPVLATADGKVIKAETVKDYGTVVRIQNGSSYQTFYAHLEDVTVGVGETVHQGQVIGHSGNSGLSSEPHLHYEVIDHGKSLNPRDFLARK